MAEAPRLFLTTPLIQNASAFVPLLEAALDAADVACVLVRNAARDEHDIKATVRALAPIIARRGAAVLIDQEPRLAARLDVDGVHVRGGGEALDEALSALKPHKIVGAGAIEGRDAAMTAGEAGADYLMFGGPDEHEADDMILDRITWWAQIFNVPCVGYASHPDLAADIAAAGAEFVGLCNGLWDRPATIGATLAQVTDAINRAVQATPEGVR